MRAHIVLAIHILFGFNLLLLFYEILVLLRSENILSISQVDYFFTALKRPKSWIFCRFYEMFRKTFATRNMVFTHFQAFANWNVIKATITRLCFFWHWINLFFLSFIFTFSEETKSSEWFDLIISSLVLFSFTNISTFPRILFLLDDLINLRMDLSRFDLFVIVFLLVLARGLVKLSRLNLFNLLFIWVPVSTILFRFESFDFFIALSDLTSLVHLVVWLFNNVWNILSHLSLHKLLWLNLFRHHLLNTSFVISLLLNVVTDKSVLMYLQILIF